MDKTTFVKEVKGKLYLSIMEIVTLIMEDLFNRNPQFASFIQVQNFSLEICPA